MAYRDADGENPFTIPPFHRPFRVIVDDDSAEAGAALALLTAFADRPGVRVYRTSTTSRTRVEILPPNESSDYVPIDYVDAEGTVEMAVPAVESWRRSTSMTIEEFGGEPEQVFRELVLAQAASRHDIDLLVTDATALDAPMWRRFRADANVAEPRTACALLGLYLRAHGDFTVRVGQVTNFLDQERYYRGAAAGALPAHDAWLHAAFTAWRQRQTPEPSSAGFRGGCRISLHDDLHARFAATDLTRRRLGCP